MSAFILLQNSQQGARLGYQKRKNSSKSKQLDARSQKSHPLECTSTAHRSRSLTILRAKTSGTSSLSQTSSILNRYASDGDSQPSIRNLPFNTNKMIIDPDEAYSPYYTRQKKLFNLDTMLYTMQPLPLLAIESRIADYEREISKLREFREHRSNLELNHVRSSSGDYLFGIRNLQVLRYTYFKEITKQYNLVQYRHGLYKPSGKHRLRYMRKIERLAAHSQVPLKVQGLPSLGEDKEYEGEEDSDYELEEEDLNDQEVPEGSKPLNMRKLLGLTRFWNDIYQDLKCAEDGTNYHELLPPMNRLCSFLIELLDHLMYNVGQVTADAADLLSSSDIQLIRTYVFSYLTDTSYDYLHLMASVYQNMFTSSVSSLPGGFERVSRALVSVLTEYLRERMQSPEFRGRGYDAVFSLWVELLEYVFLVVLRPNVGVFKTNFSMGSSTNARKMSFSLSNASLMFNLRYDSIALLMSLTTDITEWESMKQPTVMPLHRFEKPEKKKRGFFQKFKRSSKRSDPDVAEMR